MDLDATVWTSIKCLSSRARLTTISSFIPIFSGFTLNTVISIPIGSHWTLRALLASRIPKSIQWTLTTTRCYIVDFSACTLDWNTDTWVSIVCLSSRAILTATWIYTPILSWIALNTSISIPIRSDWAFKTLLSSLIPISSSGTDNASCWAILIMRSLRTSHYYFLALICRDGIFKPNITVITSFFSCIIKLSTFALFACKCFFIPEAWVWACVAWLAIEIRGFRGALTLIRRRVINLSNWAVCYLRV